MNIYKQKPKNPKVAEACIKYAARQSYNQGLISEELYSKIMKKEEED